MTTDPFARFGAAMVRLRWVVLAIWLAVLGVAGGLVAPRASLVVKGGGFVVPGSDSAQASQILAEEFNASATNSVVVVFHSADHVLDDAAYRDGVGMATDRLNSVPGVRAAATYYNTGDSSFAGKDSHTTIALVAVDGDEGEVGETVPKLRDALAGVPLEHYLTGLPAINQDTFTTSERDLRSAEVFTIPIVLVLLLLVFRTVVAAVIPLALGGCGVVLAIAAVALIAPHLDTSIFALNVASMIGLGLGIDFSLIVINRYREERAAGRDPAQAVALTMSTAGRSITYSGITVILSMLVLTLLLMNLMIVRSISMAVMLVAVMALLAGLTLLPAIIAILGDRLEWLPVLPRRRTSRAVQAGVWYRFSHAIMRRPWAWLAASLVILLVIAWPVRNLAMVGASTGVLPAATESVKGARVLDDAFGANRLNPIQIVLRTGKDGVWDPQFLTGLAKLSDALKVDRRVQEVSSLYTLWTANRHAPEDRFDALTSAYFTPLPDTLRQSMLDPSKPPELPGSTLQPVIYASLDAIPTVPALVGFGAFQLPPGAALPSSSATSLNVFRLLQGTLTLQAEGPTSISHAQTPQSSERVPVGAPYTLNTGDQLVVPADTGLSLRNDGTSTAALLDVTMFVVRSSAQPQASWNLDNPSADLFRGLPRQVLVSGVVTELPQGSATLEVDRVTATPGAVFPKHTHGGPELLSIESGNFRIYTAPPNEMTLTRADGRGVEAPFDTPVVLTAGDRVLVQAERIHRAEAVGDTPTILYSTRIYPSGEPPFMLVGVRELAARFVNLDADRNTAVISVVSRFDQYDSEHQTLVYDLRQKLIPDIPELRPYETYVGGNAAAFIDFRDSLYGRFPIIAATVMIMIFLILMMFFQSVFLPIKAMLLNLASILATYGALVVIFQYGYGTNLLGFESQGLVNVVTPAILYVVLFALSTDYEVFMLSRVREYYHELHNNEEAVARGLEHTAGVITAAGLILVGTFGSFAAANIVTLKEIGLGLAIGVFLDSTIVRIIMVPATMRLAGAANWWMPAWLARIVPELKEGPSLPAPAAPPAAAAGANGPVWVGHLRPRRGSIGTQDIVLWPTRPLRIGRDESNDLQLFDERVSPAHARVDFDPEAGMHTVVDLGSARGVFVNGDRIEPLPAKRPLCKGDVLDVGGTGEVLLAYEVEPVAHAAGSTDQQPVHT